MIVFVLFKTVVLYFHSFGKKSNIDHIFDTIVFLYEGDIPQQVATAEQIILDLRPLGVKPQCVMCLGFWERTQTLRNLFAF